MSHLATLHPHEKDEFIHFEEIGHKYTIHGESDYISVTTLIGTLFEHFDANKIVDTMLKNTRNFSNPDYKYYNMTREEILTSWSKNGDDASKKGTAMHLYIENYYNQIYSDESSIEIDYFKCFLKTYPELKPYRTEWTVFYSKYKVCGSIDMLFENPNGTLEIYDWKRVKQIEYKAFGNKTGLLPCISDMPDTNFWHYCLQLNLYKFILENQYDKKVTSLFLVCLHPDNANKTFERIEVPVLDYEIFEILENLLSKKNASKD